MKILKIIIKNLKMKLFIRNFNIKDINRDFKNDLQEINKNLLVLIKNNK